FLIATPLRAAAGYQETRIGMIAAASPRERLHPELDLVGLDIIGSLVVGGLISSEARGELKRLNEELEARISVRTAQLAAASRELSATNAGLQREIARRVEVESQLMRRAEELSRSSSELEWFVSHDLQEPLRMVASFTQLLRQRYRGNL